MLRPSTFSLEVVEGTFSGYTRGDDWNGWATPYFPLDEAKRIADALRLAPSGAEESMDLQYDAEADAFIVHDPFAPDEAESWPAITSPDVPCPLYPIGTYIWTWEEVDRRVPVNEQPLPARPITLHLVFEAGIDRLTGEPLPREEEMVTVEASTAEQAARLVMHYTRINPRGRLVTCTTPDGNPVYTC